MDEIRTTNSPLRPETDSRLLKELQLIAVRHRKRLLRLGEELDIRLHYGAIMSMVEIVTLLYFYWMRIRPEEPTWPDRDRFILSKGHGAPSLYVALSMRGFFDDTAFADFRMLGSRLQGHPDRKRTPGVDCGTGSLGQGMPVACGMALGARLLGASFHVYTLVSDGECNEGSIWEAALIASNLGLDRIVVLLDRNHKSSYGEMNGRNDIEPLADKWRAFGWRVHEANGHDFVSLSAALSNAELDAGPSIVICHTIKGKGIPFVEQNRTPSNFSLSEDDRRAAMAALNSTEVELVS